MTKNDMILTLFQVVVNISENFGGAKISDFWKWDFYLFLIPLNGLPEIVDIGIESTWVAISDLRAVYEFMMKSAIDIVNYVKINEIYIRINIHSKDRIKRYTLKNYKPVGWNIGLGEMMLILKTKLLDITSFTYAKKFDKYFAF